MKKILLLIVVAVMAWTVVAKEPATPLNRGLIAARVSNGVLVSWRKRAYDASDTKYKLYRGSTLVTTLTTKTNYLDASGTSGTVYRIDVCDAANNVLETQTCKAWSGQYLAIPLQAAPADTKGTGATYTPNDAQCYDMDGDGEQEIVFKWEPSNVKDAASSGKTGAVWLECVKLDGTSLWRINLGQNIWASQHTVSFLCYDFDGDGYGEMIVKTAPGTVDGQGKYVLMGNDDPKANYGNNDKPTSGPEYVSVFDGQTGAALSTISYWPAFKDGKSYGDSKNNRAFRFNTTLARLNVDGKAKPCAVMNRGYYAQAYYQAVTFDGKQLRQLWRAEFTTSGKGMYGEGYHTLQSADVDNDGFDEIIVGSAVMDHDGTSLWRTGDGHGDALHVGDFDWDNPGLEIYSVKESSSAAYDCTMRDGRTGKLLWGLKQTGGDTGRGLIGDFDDQHEGAESFHSSSASMYDCKGKVICDWHIGTTSSSSINYRIYWDGDLYDEYHDRSHFDKWSSASHSWGTTSFRYNIGPGSSTINDSKYVPNLQADILGDWREEAVFWYTIDASKGLYGLNLITTNEPSDYALDYLRDDPVYDNAIAWQNTTYNQPPHLGYSPVLKFSAEIQAQQQSQYMFIPYYSDYQQSCPAGVEVYYVPGYSKLGNNQDTVRMTQYKGGYIPAAKAVLLRVTDFNKYRLIVSGNKANSFSTDYLFGKGQDYTVENGLKSSPTSVLAYYYYEFREDPLLGYGFFKIPDGPQQFPAHHTLLRIQVNTSKDTAQDYYRLGAPWNDAYPLAIEQLWAGDAETEADERCTYDLTGRQALSQGKGLMVGAGRVVFCK